MRLTEPNQLYVYLWKALGGSKVTTEHAKNLLAKKRKIIQGKKRLF